MRAPVLLSLLLVSACHGTRPSSGNSLPDPLCVLKEERLPKDWGPPGRVHEMLSQAEWSPAEARDAERAVQTGLDELNAFFAGRPAAVAALDTDTVESLIDPAYAANNMPKLRTAAFASARQALHTLMMPELNRDVATAGCKDAGRLLKFTAFAQQLEPTGSSLTSKLTALTNASFRACGPLTAAMGYDYHAELISPSLTTDDLWDMVMWSIAITDAQTVPGLYLPAGASALPPELWRFLTHYPFAGARSYRDGANDEKFHQTAYLITHIAYIPTGYGRHRIYVSDAPYLYRFLRENFYPVLDMGELDLTAEFVDLFRQYGCTENNDLQVRDGTRYLLKLYQSAHNSWINYREPDESGAVDNYSIIHKPWTGMSGVRARTPEPATAGTYGSVVRAWMGSPQ